MHVKKYHLLIINLLFFQYLTAQVVISGIVKNYDKQYITFWKQSSYELPFDLDTIFLDNQKFNIEIKTDEVVSINIDFFKNTGSKTIHTIALFASPRDTIYINIDFSKYTDDRERVSCEFEGKNAKGHQLFYEYYYYPLIHHLDRFYSIIRNKEDPISTYKKLMAEIEIFTLPYRTLLQQNQIDSIYFKVVTDHIKTSIFTTILSDFYEDGGIYLKTYDKINKQNFINGLIYYLPPFERVDLLARWRTFYIITSLRYHEVIKNGFNTFSDIRDTTILFKNIEYRIIKDFTPILALKDDKLKEFLFAHQLLEYYRIFLVKKMTDYFDDVFAFFKAIFPNSVYIPVIENAKLENSNIITILEDTSHEIAPARYFPLWQPIIIDDVGKMDYFNFKNDLINFSIGTYYIDIWATWCQPCLAEMKYNYETDSLLEANNIERLYISIDEQDDYNKWLAKIYEHNLGGYHVLAGEKLKQMLSQQFGGGDDATMMIPRYLFIKDGKIINKAAARPSAFQQLVIQVDQLSKM